ncbi:membrane protein [Gordonia phage Trine]|uniref:Membrane protein n=1 Tax=Gordonia phage Trine TaxID=2201431 RepID=A0A2Z4Q9G5_9CAUD|nr:membrane protein [Gordonia phage Trine]AWY06525.1 membrane protein [Gordonia phage Trine]
MDFAQFLGELAKGLGYGTIGLVLGMALTWKRTRVGNMEIPIPTPHPDPGIWRKSLGILLVIVAVASMTQVAVLSVRQSKCNEEFRRVIKERGDAAAEQSALWAELETKLSELGPIDTPEEEAAAVLARQWYVKKYEDALEARRSNPYPDPRCD